MSAKRLYEYCIQNVSKVVVSETKSLKCLPTNVLFDVLYRMAIDGKSYYLDKYFVDLDTMYRLLVQMNERRNSMHFMFQSVMNFDLSVGKTVVENYRHLCQQVCANGDGQRLSSANKWTKAKFGLCLGTFLREGGWYELSADVFRHVIALYHNYELHEDLNVLKLVFECHWKLLSSLNTYCLFYEAMKQMEVMLHFMMSFEMSANSSAFNLSQVYTEFAQLFFFQSRYDESYKWAIESIQALSPSTPIFTVIDVYRQAAKTSVVKREFKRAKALINQAIILSAEMFGVTEDQNKYNIDVIHLKLADVFLDYGFYLLNVDLISHSVKLYEMALEIREYIFGLNDDSIKNLLIALTHEELGYASYVHEYSSGNFLNASFHANKAMSIVDKLVPDNHLLLASAKRVKALILEEIAIDHQNSEEEEKMLKESRELHMSALNMARQAFGETNVQTAKHYGNLGRLYQSMKEYSKAEAMHLKAIHIKESLLGPNDYEVALSLGHLASLYNYDMHLYDRAEKLYLRSIDIGIKLFGVGYSGLEYDYRGLCHIYSRIPNEEKLREYMHKLHHWKHLRDTIAQTVKDSPPIQGLRTVQKLSPQQMMVLIQSQ